MKVVQLQMMESKAGMPAQATQRKWFETITKLLTDVDCNTCFMIISGQAHLCLHLCHFKNTHKLWSVLRAGLIWLYIIIKP